MRLGSTCVPAAAALLLLGASTFAAEVAPACASRGFTPGTVACTGCATLSKTLSRNHQLVRECYDCCTQPLLMPGAPGLRFPAATLRISKGLLQDGSYAGTKEFLEKHEEASYGNLHVEESGGDDGVVELRPAKAKSKASKAKTSLQADVPISLQLKGWKMEHIHALLRRHLKGADQEMEDT